MAVKVQFEIGHTAKLRNKRTVEGFTHDWELYVKGAQQADISLFVEKIIFRLHESFQNHNRVFKEPPYIVQESGYAGFIVFIDIYFRNRDEPKKVQYSYDLDLQNTGPPHSRSEIKTFIFDNPSEEYRQKLLKGGGVPVSGVVGGQATTMNNNISSMPMGASLNHSPGESHKNLVAEGKKHKSRPDDLRSNSFANLFGPPITKTTAGITTALTKHSPDNKVSVASANHQNSSSSAMPIVKDKSLKDKDKSSEKSKDRSSKKEKHHKQSLTSPHKEGRSESKKSEGSKHEKRERNEEKSKKDKSRDKEREREKSSSANVNHNSSNNKRPSSPKPAREHSPHKTGSTNSMAPIVHSSNVNSIPRPSSSNSSKIEDVKSSSKSSKDTAGENKSKLREISSSSSGKKSKKEKKDKDKDKERDKERRHEEKEKQKISENQQRSAAKDDTKSINAPINNPNNTNTTEHKNSKAASNSNVTTNVTHTNDGAKKSDKIAKQDLIKSNEKPIANNTSTAALVAPANNTSHSVLNEKKSSSGSSVNSNSNPSEKDKRSHKHKKKEKNKDKDKDKERERDKEREKDKDKERDKDKDKDKERERDKDGKKEKEAKEKHYEEKSSEGNHTAQTAKAVPTPNICTSEEPLSNANSSSSSTVSSTPVATSMPTNASATSLSSTSRSSKNKEKKSKEKSSKEEKVKHKSSEADTGESKSKQPKLNTTNSLSASSSILISTTNPSTALQPLTGISRAENNLSLDLSDTDSLPPASSEGKKKTAPAVAHSDSSNSSFPDLPLPKPQPATKSSTAVHESAKPAVTTTPVAIVAPLNSNTSSKETPKNIKPAKDKPQEKPAKEEEKDKKRRRNSVAVNTFIEPPIKQMKKEQTKSVREKSKSPSLRNTGTRASISSEASTTFLQPSASPSSTAAAAPLPPPSSNPSAAHSPALSATEAVGNAASATANAATCNSNTAPLSTINSSSSSSVMAPHQLPLDYLSELQELHHKIMTLQDNDDLQHVVELIAATGCYEITTKTFDFDLCKLDRGTVQRLQEFFATSVS